MGIDFKKRLGAMQARWETGRKNPPGPPAGVYEMRLQAASLRESSSGKLYVRREHYILDGEAAGEVAYDNLNFETDNGMFFLGQWVDQMGFELPEDLADIEETIAAIVDASPTYIGKIIKRDGFTNVNIQRVLAEGDESEPVEPEEAIAPPPRGAAKAKAAPPARKVVEPEKAPDDENRVALLAFAQAMNIDDVDEESTTEALVEAMQGYEWDLDQLVPEEVELLVSNGVAQAPAPKAKAKAKAKTR